MFLTTCLGSSSLFDFEKFYDNDDEILESLYYEEEFLKFL